MDKKGLSDGRYSNSCRKTRIQTRLTEREIPHVLIEETSRTMEEETNESSLHFISTQIQSRHEDLESREKCIGKLSRFKNSLDKVVSPQTRVVKKKTRKVPGTKKARPTSLSAFVRETLGSKKQVDTQNILDFFTGDEIKMNNFLDRLEEKTKGKKREKTQHNRDTLVGEKEWKSLLDGLQLRFPAFLKKNHRSLTYITRKIEELQQRERTPPDASELQSMWSQASKQLSDNLTAEDVKWLYDLDEEHLDHTTFDTYSQNSQQEPLALTLSQVFDQVLQRGEDVSSVISNSESEPEADFMDNWQNNTPENRKDDASIPSHQYTSIPDSVDVLTSINFASTFPGSERTARSNKTAPSKPESPFKETVIRTPRSSPRKNWPANLIITSSPIQDSNNSQEVFLTAPTNEASRTQEKVSRSTIVFHGAIRLSLVDTNITMKIQQAPLESDVVPDSEDEGELTVIEITKPVSKSVLQVPSSPGLDLPPVLHPGDEVPITYP